MKGRVVFFEVAGGNDKGPDGHRRDTMPMVEEVRKKGIEPVVVYYDHDRRHELFKAIIDSADAYVSRVNPGNIPGGEGHYLEMLRYLGDTGVVGMADADTMVEMGAKDALVKLVGTGLALPDTYAYYTVEELRSRFPVSLSRAERVLKQNRGSTGSGIWHVVVEDERAFPAGEPLPMDTRVKCVEASDNHVEHRTLGDFLTLCERCIAPSNNGMIVDMRFLPRIKEGEIRILMVGARPMFVVHKKPREDDADAFSATLFSGAKYTYDRPENWSHLVDDFIHELPELQRRLGVERVPLIWTADFMLDTAPDGTDRYVLGEINCSCVGFTSHLDLGIQKAVADEIASALADRDGLHTHPDVDPLASFMTPAPSPRA
jgi:hypothetical protein